MSTRRMTQTHLISIATIGTRQLSSKYARLPTAASHRTFPRSRALVVYRVHRRRALSMECTLGR
jgi:hypothetical protein